ncbi:hypothetical protein FACS189421_12440 [Bacteroidia bacterium]|nr:hypothetical protein FACS189421_12440 [Bacteroidia bacterium]GHT52549.1 hypothetical protein FACS189440_22070 [Bacteroidia bacterium]
MKKNLILMLLLLAGAGSMKGQQEIPDGPRMVVTGNVVNTGIITAVIPIDLRTNGQIDNEEDGEITTPFLNVDAGSLVNNKGYICVGCGPDTPPVEEGYRTYCYPGDVGCWMIDNSKEGTYYAKSYGATDLPDGAGLYAPGERGYYYTYPVDDTACPSGFRIPYLSEWQKLLDYMQGSSSSDIEKNHWLELGGMAPIYSGSWGGWDQLAFYWAKDGTIIIFDGWAASFAETFNTSTKSDYSYQIRCIKN